MSFWSRTPKKQEEPQEFVMVSALATFNDVEDGQDGSGVSIEVGGDSLTIETEDSSDFCISVETEADGNGATNGTDSTSKENNDDPFVKHVHLQFQSTLFDKLDQSQGEDNESSSGSSSGGSSSSGNSSSSDNEKLSNLSFKNSQGTIPFEAPQLGDNESRMTVDWQFMTKKESKAIMKANDAPPFCMGYFMMTIQMNNGSSDSDVDEIVEMMNDAYEQRKSDLKDLNLPFDIKFSVRKRVEEDTEETVVDAFLFVPIDPLKIYKKYKPKWVNSLRAYVSFPFSPLVNWKKTPDNEPFASMLNGSIYTEAKLDVKGVSFAAKDASNLLNTKLNSMWNAATQMLGMELQLSDILDAAQGGKDKLDDAAWEFRKASKGMPLDVGTVKRQLAYSFADIFFDLKPVDQVDQAAMLVYEIITEKCQGIKQIQLHSSAFNITTNFENFNIIEVFPSPQEMNSAAEKYQVSLKEKIEKQKESLAIPMKDLIEQGDLSVEEVEAMFAAMEGN